MSAFDFFIALDGNGLNGFEGFAGVARLRCDPARGKFEPSVHFFSGLAGGHALQIAPGGRIAFLGNLSQTLLFFDPRSLREIQRISSLRFAAPEVSYESQTHVVWLDDENFITVLGPDFYQFSLNDLNHPKRLGAHGVTVPHAIKRSPSGRYLCYGALDHDHKGYANQVGIFDLETNSARVVSLPATVWHIGVHPHADLFYAPTQRCAPQGTEFVEYTIAHFKNYLFEIDAETATVNRHMTIPKDLPGALTSDVVVTADHVIYNACASGVLVRVDLKTLSHVEYVDELPSSLDTLRRLPVAFANVLETFSRANVIANPHVLLKALRITRGSAIDGSYGLQLSPDGRYLLSAHRGLNEVIVYEYPSLKELRRIRFPSIRGFFPEHFGPLCDPRLGFHHSALSTATLPSA